MDDHLTFTIVGKERYGDVVDFVYKDFFSRETLAQCIGLDLKPISKFNLDINNWLSHGVSLVAIDPRTDQIVGICVNYIMADDDEPIETESRKLERIFKFLGHLEEDYNVHERLGVQRGMELLFLGVKEEYCGRGIARKLAEKAIELARSQGIEFIVTNPTAAATCHLFHSLGFETIREMKLIDYFVKGQPGFPYATGNEITRFCVKKLWL